MLITFLLHNYIHEKEKDLKIIGLFILSLSIAIFIASFGDNIIHNTALQWSYWALIGGFLSLKIKNPLSLHYYR